MESKNNGSTEQWCNRPERSSGARWATVLVAVLGWACGDLEEEAPLGSTSAPLVEKESGDQAMAETTCNLVLESRLTLRVDEVSAERVTLIVENPTQVDAQVDVLGTSFGDEGRSTSAKKTAHVRAGATAIVRLEAKELALARRADIHAGKVQFTAHAIFADGSKANATAGAVYYAFSNDTDAGELSATPNVKMNRLSSNLRSFFEDDPARAVEHALTQTDEWRDDVDDGIVGDSVQEEPLPVPREVSTSREGRANPAGAKSATERGRSGAPGFATSAVVNKTLCFRVGTTYTDAGFGEDTYTSSTFTFRDAINNRVRMVLPGIATYNFNLADSGALHCHTRIYNTGTYAVAFFADGSPGGRFLQVSEPGGAVASSYSSSVTVNNSNPQIVNLNATGSAGEQALHIYQAAALALQGHAGLGSGSVVYERSAAGSAFFYDLFGAKRIFVPDPFWTGKFGVAHELGHRVHDIAGALPAPALDYSLSGGGNCQDPPAPLVWGWTSKEYQSAVFTEAFADFYGADAFNSHDQNDCVHFSGVDCDVGGAPASPVGPNPPTPIEHEWFEDRCSNPLSGRGSVIDWERVFWNVHTDGTGTDPSMNTMLDWMEDADDMTSWSATNVFELLEDEADARADVINTRWDVHSDDHEIDHP